jgi:NAD+ synthase (glutamine-hydrolysing)
MDETHPMKGFARVAVAVPPCRVADVEHNTLATLDLWRRAHDEGAHVVVFPELGLSAYTARDLFFDSHLLHACEAHLAELCEAGADLAPMAIVGLPLRVGHGIYNVAAALWGGRILGIVPKSYLPTYREFEEHRWFRPGTDVAPGLEIELFGQSVPFGTDILFEADGVADLVVGAEICEDLWVQHPPSMAQASAGATVCVNLSASNFTIGKADVRRSLCASASDRGKCAYLYVAAGPGESSTDLAFDADAFVCELGDLLAQSERFHREPQLVCVDVDLERIVHERISTNSFGDCANFERRPFRRAHFAVSETCELKRDVPAHPFLPRDPATLATRCWEIFEIQTNALLTRMQAIGEPRLVLGVSGGLDSTHAALVSAVALDMAGRPRSDLICVTMPGLGTSDATRGNAEDLARHLGATFLDIGIDENTRLVLESIEHRAAAGVSTIEELIERLREDPDLGDPALQNVQARLRTLVLMSLANQRGGIVVGTGDLSEKALGWSTYAGDHIAMYDVNASVPKTLIQFVIKWVAGERLGTWSVGDPAKLKGTLEAILDTPISPELLPPDAEGKIGQLTEETIGPYELHDFFLFHFVRHGAGPTRILELARHAFGDRYDAATLKRWARVFLRRFFQQQFKRSCTADAPKVGSVALSPRGDWRMPSDAQVGSWLSEVEAWRG